MKAWVQHRYGDADVLQLQTDVPQPTPAADEVLVRVHAVGLNAADVHLMTGWPFLARIATGLRRPRQPVLGTDFAGVVTAVGRDVTHVQQGDAVMGEVMRGSLAEYVVAPGKSVTHQPASTSHVEAAALPMGALTALQAMRDAKVRPGDRVLVNGASGGVGVYTVQMAAALGAKVTAVCSGRNLELVRSLGAIDAVDYRTRDFTATTERYDVIVDIVSTRPIARCRAILTPEGRYAVVGAVAKGRLLGVGRQMRAVAMSPFTRQSLMMVMAGNDREDLAEIAAMVEGGKVRPVIDAVYDFADAPTAVRHLHAGHARGKVVVEVLSTA
jgi:NADPH:quinone reductase-like Zn-dependent oxidoreductase